MTDDDLLREARNALERHGNHVAKPICMTCELIACIDARLASGGWIKASERLPTKKDGDKDGCVWTHLPGAIRARRWPITSVITAAKTHNGLKWQPLPALPKGES